MSFLVMGSNGVFSANLFLVPAIALLNGGVLWALSWDVYIPSIASNPESGWL